MKKIKDIIKINWLLILGFTFIIFNIYLSTLYSYNENLQNIIFLIILFLFPLLSIFKIKEIKFGNIFLYFLIILNIFSSFIITMADFGVNGNEITLIQSYTYVYTLLFHICDGLYLISIVFLTSALILSFILSIMLYLLYLLINKILNKKDINNEK